MTHPDVRFDVEADPVLEAHGDETPVDDVLTVLGKRHARPLFPVGDRRLDAHRLGRDGEHLRAEPLVRAQPRIEQGSVRAPPGRETLHRDERIALLERRPNGSDQAVETLLAREGAHVLQHHAAERPAAVLGVDHHLDRAERRRGAGEAVGERPVDATGLRNAVPGDGKRVRLRDELFAVERIELELRRVVEVMRADGAAKRFAERIASGFLYGDFQFSVDEKSPDFLRLGVFSCYEPIADDTPITAAKHLGNDDWLDLLTLAYTDRAKAFQRYADYYLSTNGQTYWSDTNQLSAYLPNYAQKLKEKIRDGNESSLIITEIYVPRMDLPDFLAEAAELLRSNRTIVIYGTVRLIEKDDESFLAWAKEPYACIIFNLLTLHTPGGIEASARSFRGLIGLAITRGGSYYLTYHKFAKPEQVMACYPQFKQFLDLKRKYDPTERFQSDWYRYYRKLFAT